VTGEIVGVNILKVVSEGDDNQAFYQVFFWLADWSLGCRILDLAGIWLAAILNSFR
jgi:hypothetical protein